MKVLVAWDGSVLRRRLQALRTELYAELMARDRVLAEPVEARGEDATPSQHPADVGTDLFERESAVGLQLAFRWELAEVLAALERMDEGTYGACLDCGARIAAERLEARPHAARCLDCQRRFELATAHRRRAPAL